MPCSARPPSSSWPAPEAKTKLTLQPATETFRWTQIIFAQEMHRSTVGHNARGGAVSIPDGKGTGAKRSFHKFLDIHQDGPIHRKSPHLYIGSEALAMNIYEQVLNLIWILMGFGICLYSIGLKLWMASKPGSGLIPFIAGFIIGIVGLVRFVGDWRKAAGKEKVKKFWENPAYRRRIFFVLVGFFAMAVLLPKLGFLFTSVIVTSFLLYVIEPQNIFKVIGIAIMSCLGVYVLFVTLLQVNLPRGFLGF
jgi:putative tricarboxylic transport membrane protein